MKSLKILSPILYLLVATPTFASGLGDQPAGINEIETLFGRFISISVFLGFVALVVVLVLAGVKYITSGGEAKALSQAHQTVTWALLGILFMALAWIILLLIAEFTGIDALRIFNLRLLCGADSAWCPAPPTRSAPFN